MKLNKEKVILLLLFSFLWIYLWLRAYYVPFIHDEIATFFHYIHSKRFIPFVNANWYANNHVLNSILAFCSYTIFGSHELALRLPNLLFFPVFFYYCYKLFSEIKDIYLRWLFILVLCLSHYFIEFFAFCRGYGIAMASLMASAYYLMQFIRHNRSRHYFLSLLFGIVAALANLTLINSAFLVAGFGALNFFLHIRDTGRKKTIRNLLVLFFAGIVPLIFLTVFAIAMQKDGLLDVGTHEGFWKISIKTNTYPFTGTQNSVPGIYAILLYAASVAVFVYLFSKKLKFSFFLNSRFIFFYLLSGNIFITLFLGNFFNVNYPEDRAAIYFFPLLIASFCFLADELPAINYRKVVKVISLPLLFLPVYFFFQLNLSYSTLWKYLRLPYRYYDEIVASCTPENPMPTIGGYQMRSLAWAFINYRRGQDMNMNCSAGYPYLNADYQLAMMSDRPDWKQYYDSLDGDPYSGICLLKRKQPARLSLLVQTTPLSSPEKSNDEFFTFFEGPVDSLVGKTLLLTIDLSVKSYNSPFVAEVVAAVHDEHSDNMRYEFVQLDYYKEEWNGEPHNLRKKIILHELPKDSRLLKVYLWSINKKPYTAKDATCRVEIVGGKLTD